MPSSTDHRVLEIGIHANEVATVVGPNSILEESPILPVPKVDLLAVGFDPLQGSYRSSIRFSHLGGHGFIERNASPADEQHSKDVGDEQFHCTSSSAKSLNSFGQGDLRGVLNVMIVSAGSSPSPSLLCISRLFLKLSFQYADGSCSIGLSSQSASSVCMRSCLLADSAAFVGAVVGAVLPLGGKFEV